MSDRVSSTASARLSTKVRTPMSLPLLFCLGRLYTHQRQHQSANLRIAFWAIDSTNGRSGIASQPTAGG